MSYQQDRNDGSRRAFLTKLTAQAATLAGGMALAGHPGVASADDGKTVYGSAFLDAFFEPGQEVSDAVKLRYKCRVAENQCARSEMWKIIFSNDGTRSYLQSGEIIELK